MSATIKMWKSRFVILGKAITLPITNTTQRSVDRWKKFWTKSTIDSFFGMGFFFGAIFMIIGSCVWFLHLSPYSLGQSQKPASLSRMNAAIEKSECVREELARKTKWQTTAITNATLNYTISDCEKKEDPLVEQQRQLLVNRQQQLLQRK